MRGHVQGLHRGFFEWSPGGNPPPPLKPLKVIPYLISLLQMTYRLNCEMAEDFAGMMTIGYSAGNSFTPGQDNRCQPKKILPHLNMCGGSDFLCSFSFDKQFEDWSKVNNCTSDSVQTDISSTTTCNSHTSCFVGGKNGTQRGPPPFLKLCRTPRMHSAPINPPLLLTWNTNFSARRIMPDCWPWPLLARYAEMNLIFKYWPAALNSHPLLPSASF